MTAVIDALVALTERRSHADARAILEEMTDRDKLSLEAVTYLRGRTLQGTFVLVDEAQNLEPTTLKTYDHASGSAVDGRNTSSTTFASFFMVIDLLEMRCCLVY
jgi:predicted ribonuclease YlaK